MGFFKDWESAATEGRAIDYVERFLKSDPLSLEALRCGNEDELAAAFKMLKESDLSDFFAFIKDMQELHTLTANDVPCFSNFEHGAVRVSELLLFAPNGLSYDELGYRLMSSEKKVAQKKYGENHAKLAKEMELVRLNKAGHYTVLPTTWGTYLTGYSLSEKKNVLIKLLLRNKCIQNLLHIAILSRVQYTNVVGFLMPSTQRRRGSNIKCLVNFILENSEWEICLYRIDWGV